jgi:hypothetical protein
MPRSPRIGECVAAGLLALAVSVALPSGGQGAAGQAKGTLSHKGKSVTLAHAYLVTGPGAVDTKKTIRRLILTTKDLGAKIRGCQAMSCSDGEVTEGLVVDIGAGPRLNYWMALNDQKVQHSGTQPPASLRASADDPKRLAGKLSFDDSGASGPKVDVEFDAALVKDFKAAR